MDRNAEAPRDRGVNDDIEADARKAMDECPRCRGLDPAGREARVREIIDDVLASRARAAANGVQPRRRRPQHVAPAPTPERTWKEDRSPHPQETRTRAADRAREMADWVPGVKSSRLALLGWLDAHEPGHTFTTRHPRGQVYEEVTRIAA